MMKENTTYMYTIVQIFYFHSIYLVLELWKTDIHVKRVFKWGDGDGLFNFFKSDYLLVSPCAANLWILQFPWRNTSLFSKVSYNNKKSECALLNIIHYMSSLWSEISSILRIKGWLIKEGKFLLNLVMENHKFFSKNLHFLPNVHCYLEGNPNGVTL